MTAPTAAPLVATDIIRVVNLFLRLGLSEVHAARATVLALVAILPLSAPPAVRLSLEAVLRTFEGTISEYRNPRYDFSGQKYYCQQVIHRPTISASHWPGDASHHASPARGAPYWSSPGCTNRPDRRDGVPRAGPSVGFADTVHTERVRRVLQIYLSLA